MTHTSIYTGREYRNHYEYWKNALMPVDKPFRLTPDAPRADGAEPSPRQDFHHRLSGGAVEQISRFSGNNERNAAVLLLAGLEYLLALHAGLPYVILKTPPLLGGSPPKDPHPVLYVHQLQAQGSWKSHLLSTRDAFVNTYQYQNFPLSALHYTDAYLDALTDVAFTCPQAYHPFPRQVPYDLLIALHWVPDGQSVTFTFNAQKYPAGLVARLAGSLDAALAGLTNLDKPVSPTDFLAAGEAAVLRDGFAGKSISHPGTLVSTFEEIARSNPEQVALEYKGRTTTFGQLQRKSDALAEHLTRKMGVAPNDKVVLLCEKTDLAVVALLAVAKAGAVFVPVDPAWPENRFKRICAEVKPAAFLIDKARMLSLRVSAPIFVLDLQLAALPPPAGPADGQARTGEHAYVIFTSGTTGEPKGVLVSHRSLHNFVGWRRSFMAFAPGHRQLLTLPLQFDGALSEIFPALLGGATLVVPEQARLQELDYVAALLREKQVTHLMAVPSFYNLLLAHLSPGAVSLQAVTLVGERVSERLLAHHYERLPEVKLYNEYGPTEATIGATAALLEPGQPVTVGTPVDNVQVLILDQHLRMLPVGVAGEVCLSGQGLAAGYLNEEAGASGRFTSVELPGGPVAIYRTGDLGRYLPDGRLVLTGREADTVKIAGIRVSLPEVERALAGCEGVRACAVVSQGSGEEASYLEAYYQSEQELDPAHLRRLLELELPAYMCPALFNRVETFPLNSSGKLDRSKLTGLKKERTLGQEDQAANEVEEAIATICRQVFAREILSVQDSFFDLGATSLKLIELFDKIQRSFPGIITIGDLYNLGNVRKISKKISDQAGKARPEYQAEEFKL
jgi:bacitracin synthase 3